MKGEFLYMVCKPVHLKRITLEGFIGDYIRRVSEQWLIPAPDANPGMLEMFADRDRKPYRNLVSWAGEFAGKYLTGAVQVLSISGDPRLRNRLEHFVKDMISLQDDDGYLGPWPKGSHLTNKAVYPDGQVFWNWDSWGHYHVMLGLLLWYEETGDKRALNSARRIGDLFCKIYLGPDKPRLAAEGNSEMNLAPAHSLCILYRHTGTRKYLDLARQIVDEEFSGVEKGQWPCGNYLKGTLDGLQFFELPKPRWESLHPIMALAELYDITGELNYRKAFEQIWWSIANLDRHNNGGFSSSEQANGNPFDPGGIETCCTIAWMAMSVEMLKLCGDSKVADELELSFLNSVIGMHSVSGRWATYNTPMDGVRCASTQTNAFQAREGTPELNCCSVNSARGFGLLREWALMQDNNGIALNAYIPGKIETILPNGNTLTIEQLTNYPLDGRIVIAIKPSRASNFTLKLRIPRWSRHTRVTINGVPLKEIKPGSYLELTRLWKSGDKIVVNLDMRLHFWVGEEQCSGKISIYRGPILLTYDRRFNIMDPDDVPSVFPHTIRGRKIKWKGRLPPVLLMEFKASDGQILRLCDFGSAGEGGSPYRSWLPMDSNNTNKDVIFQPFASPKADIEIARILRFAIKLRYLPLHEKHLSLGHLKPNDFITQLDAIINEWPQYQQNIKRVRSLITSEADPQSIHKFQFAIERLEKEGLLDQEKLTAIKKLRENIYNKYCLAKKLTVFEISPLLPAPNDIRTVSLPHNDISFVPGNLIESVGLCDVRPAHGGKHGLVYLRMKYEAKETGKELLTYGADGPVKVWINGIEVGCHSEAQNPAVPGQFEAEAVWQAGLNEIIFALITNEGKAWGIFAAIIDKQSDLNH